MATHRSTTDKSAAPVSETMETLERVPGILSSTSSMFTINVQQRNVH